MHPVANTSLLDFGAGAGYFTFPIARAFPENNPVHVVDIQKEMLEHLVKRAKDQDLSGRIEPHLLEAIEIPIPDGTVGLAWMVNVFHEIDDRKTSLSEIFRVLAPGASLFIVDWNPAETPMGPPLSERVPEVEIITSLLEAGFSLIRSWEIYSMHLVIEAQKRQD
jgi:ubiquinone/menaquinone biosynthesis C-methylase UbiE